MAQPKFKADLIVGIDFGMTCTGVAWSMGPSWPEPKAIQRWPGKLGHEIRNKVDTSVSYNIHTGKLTTWGFLCNRNEETSDCNTLFKLHMDPDYDDDRTDDPITPAEAQRWYADYLKCLHSCISTYFRDTNPRFPRMNIEYLFSVPVTWRMNPALLADVETIVKESGFSSKRERSVIYMTEAEAAAIHVAKESFKKGELLIVCDAGGGTTDLTALKVESDEKNALELLPLSWTEGAAIGSTIIDFKVRHMIVERLQMISPHDLRDDPKDVVVKMMDEKFDSFKCSFGSAGMDVPRILLPIPGVPAGLNYPHACIEDSKVVITKHELQLIFDNQIEKLTNLIDTQLKRVREMHPGEVVSFLILSGGLGSSPYVQSRMRTRYERGARSPAFERLQILLATEPQLAVANGLVSARTQASRGGPDMYALRCCPASYGILCREEYDPVKHQGETVILDQYDGKRWAEHQIHWILRQGQVVRADTGARYTYEFKIPMGKEMEPWSTRIITSSKPANQLPQSMKRGDARELCVVETTLHPYDLKRKNRHWYNTGQEYNRAEFEVRVIVGAGLRFEIWSKDGIRKSRDHEEIDVQWQSA